jgi:V8-like Glu-specific endopeptidase
MKMGILLENGEVKNFTGTAFLIAPLVLLTAAHNVMDSKGRKVNASFYPGCHGVAPGG